jgi:hypothetical protein
MTGSEVLQMKPHLLELSASNSIEIYGDNISKEHLLNFRSTVLNSCMAQSSEQIFPELNLSRKAHYQRKAHKIPRVLQKSKIRVIDYSDEGNLFISNGAKQ